jgi:hypothetical protein
MNRESRLGKKDKRGLLNRYNNLADSKKNRLRK